MVGGAQTERRYTSATTADIVRQHRRQDKCDSSEVSHILLTVGGLTTRVYVSTKIDSDTFQRSCHHYVDTTHVKAITRTTTT